MKFIRIAVLRQMQELMQSELDWLVIEL